MATIWLDEVKSRRPRENEYVITENSSPNAPPNRIAGRNRLVALDEKSVKISPTNSPNQAPEANPPSATDGYDSRRSTRSTICRSVPTIVTFCTGNCESARWSTARCASR